MDLGNLLRQQAKQMLSGLMPQPQDGMVSPAPGPDYYQRFRNIPQADTQPAPLQLMAPPPRLPSRTASPMSPRTNDMPLPSGGTGSDLPANRAGFVNGTPDQFRSLINQASKLHGVPTKLLSALLMQESGYSPDVVYGKRKSSAGALGVAQFMPGTAAQFGINPLDPSQAIPAAAKYLKQLYDNFGNWDSAIAGYNAGGGAVQKYGGVPPFAETQNYVARIKRLMHGPSDMGNTDPQILDALRRAR